MIGYQTVTLKATQGQRLNVIMKEMSYELDGVVVIGYGSVAKKDLTGAVGVVSGKDLKDMPVSNINNVLQGKVPGMTVSSSSGTPGLEVLLIFVVLVLLQGLPLRSILWMDFRRMVLII